MKAEKTTVKRSVKNVLTVTTLGVQKHAYRWLNGFTGAKQAQFAGTGAGVFNSEKIGAGTLAASRSLECGTANADASKDADTICIYKGAQGFGFARGQQAGEWLVLAGTAAAVKFGKDAVFTGTLKQAIAFLRERGSQGELTHVKAGAVKAWIWGDKYGIAVNEAGTGLTRLEAGTDNFSKSTGAMRALDWRGKIVKETRAALVK